jgi:O-antigen/teichoic acid export membrane protein
MTGIARLIVKNTLFNLFGRFVSRFANFFLVPFILFKIGVAEFGLFSILNIFFYYASLADLGTGASLPRFMAADVARNDFVGLSRRVLGQVLFCFLVTLALAVFLQILGGWFLSFFSLHAHTLQRMRYLVVVFVLGMGMGLMGNIFHSLLQGYQRMDMTNGINVLTVIPNVIGTIWLLQAGYGLEGLVWVFFVVQALGLLTVVFVVGEKFPQIGWARHWPDKEGFVETVRLGFHLQWMRVVGTMSRTMDQILLAPMVGLSGVTIYALASRPVLVAQELGSIIVSATIPVVAHLDSRNSHADRQRVQKLLLFSQRYMNGFVAIALAFFGLASGVFVGLWLGPGYSEIAAVMKIMAFGHLLPLLMTPGTNELVGKGNLSMLTPILTIQALLHVLLTWWLIKSVGLLGPAFGLAGASAYGTIHFLMAFYRSQKVVPPPVPAPVMAYSEIKQDS